MSFRIVRGASAMMASLLATSSLFAGAQTDPCCCVKPNGCKGVTLCHTQPDIDWNRFRVDVGFILEQARVTGSAYAYTATGNTSTGAGYNLLPQTTVSIQVPKFDLDWGVTVGLGYDFEHDNWYIAGHFDWLQTTGTDNTANSYSSVVVPMNIWFRGLNGGSDLGAVTGANTNFQINYYNVMFDLGRGTYLTDCLVINPHAGLKLSFIYDNVNNQYTGGSIAAGNAVNRSQDTDFWGVGPSFGLDTAWSFTEGWSMFVDTNVAILLSYANAKDQVVDTYNSVTYATNASTGTIPTFSPTIRTILGLSYDRKIYCDQQMISGRLGWDTSIFWNQFNHIDVVSGAGAVATNGFDAFFLREGETFGLTGLIFELGWSF
jgi:hypothetical protein